jgi:hypothetical protein
MSEKFIPNGDSQFALKALVFLKGISKERERFGITQEDVDAFGEALRKFDEALARCHSTSRSGPTKRAKDDARKVAVDIMRRLGHVVRHNPRIDAATKMSLGLRMRRDAKVLPCPEEPPRLRFVRAHHESVSAIYHELEFTSLDFKSRPEGAVRLELFVDLVPPEEEIPAYPGANHAGRPWYLRSYTKSPIKLTPPMARVPMRVVYWGRWADTQGNVGPFSATAAGWIEGGSHALLPGGTGLQLNQLNGPKPVRILEDASASGPAGREEKFHVALLEVRYGTLNASEIAAALPSPVQSEVRQLEAPPKSEAA